jgi:hypothetical protein
MMPAQMGEDKMAMYYPEMGETAPKSAIVTTWHVINSTYAAKWLPEHDATVRSLFATLRIRPRRIEQYQTIHGSMKWSALITAAAKSKLTRHPLAAAETLLD